MLKSTGIVRNLDALGRITLPRELRRTLDIPECGPLEIFVHGSNIVLRKYAPGCTFCGIADGDLKTFREKVVCSECAEAIGH